MDEIQELKQALGSIGERYNDAQLRQLSRELDVAVEFLLALYADEHRENTQTLDTPPVLTESMRAVR